MRFEQLKAGATVWDVHTYKMGNTKMRSVGIWSVRVIEVHDDRSITASWNGNPARRMMESQWRKFRLKQPALVRDVYGRAKIAPRTLNLS